jgi:hypothetical protein
MWQLGRMAMYAAHAWWMSCLAGHKLQCGGSSRKFATVHRLHGLTLDTVEHCSQAGEPLCVVSQHIPSLCPSLQPTKAALSAAAVLTCVHIPVCLPQCTSRLTVSSAGAPAVPLIVQAKRGQRGAACRIRHGGLHSLALASSNAGRRLPRLSAVLCPGVNAVKLWALTLLSSLCPTCRRGIRRQALSNSYSLVTGQTAASGE